MNETRLASTVKHTTDRWGSIPNISCGASCESAIQNAVRHSISRSGIAHEVADEYAILSTVQAIHSGINQQT